MSARWTDETEELACHAAELATAKRCGLTSVPTPLPGLREDVRAVLTAIADAGLLRRPEEMTQAEADGAWRHNAKLHNDMRRRIQQVATHAAAEQRSLSWVADELTDILDDPQAWRGETAPR